MPRFVRWIVIIAVLCTVVAIALNVGATVIVSRHRREAQQAMGERLTKHYQNISGRSRQAVLAMEGRQINASGRTVATQLLWLPLGFDEVPMHADAIQRITLPGDGVSVQGRILTFAPDFHIKPLAGATLFLFTTLAVPDKPDTRVLLRPTGEPPIAYRVAKEASPAERQIWSEVDAALGHDAESAPGITVSSFEKTANPVDPNIVYHFRLDTTGLSVQSHEEPELIQRILTAAQDRDKTPTNTNE